MSRSEKSKNNTKDGVTPTLTLTYDKDLKFYKKCS